MTANAMESDREQCIEAGMDNFISKPVRVELLQKSLIAAAKARRKEGGPASPAFVDVSPMVDATEAVLEQMALELDRRAVSDLASSFIQDASEYFEKIDACRDTKPQDEIAALAHSLKGALGVFQLTGIMELCVTAQNEAIAGRATEALSLLDNVRADFDRIRFPLEERIRSMRQ